MTGNSVVLDTNVVIELFKGNKAVALRFEGSGTINIPFIVLGELCLGAYCSANPEKHLKQIKKFPKHLHRFAG